MKSKLSTSRAFKARIGEWQLIAKIRPPIFLLISLLDLSYSRQAIRSLEASSTAQWSERPPHWMANRVPEYGNTAHGF